MNFLESGIAITALLAAMTVTASAAPKDIVDTAVSAGSFNTLAAALKAADLVEKLRSILLYHVVSGDVMAAQVVKMTSAKTANGKEVKISTHGDTVMVNNAKVVKADVAASNGVIHVIDTVLLPSE